MVEIAEIPAVSRDLKDDKFLATAQAGGVAYVVSADIDLLTLKEYNGIKIVDVPSFLRNSSTKRVLQVARP